MRTAVETTLRHLATLTLVPVYPKKMSTAAILKELRDKDPEFDVNIRSIQRSLDQLSRVFPISCEKLGNSNFWFWTNHTAFVELPAMSMATAFALRLASEHLRPIMPPATLSMLNTYFDRADEILQKTELGTWQERTAIVDPGLRLIPPDISSDVQEVIYAALMQKRKVNVKYRRKHAAEPKEIDLNPLGLVIRSNIAYLVATSWRYNDIRHYVLHRMSNPRMLDEQTEIPSDFRLCDHLDEYGSFAYPASDREIKLRAVFTEGAGFHLTESYLSPDHAATPLEDSRMLVEATVADTAQLRWWLSAFGSMVEVLEPAFLRDELRDEAQKLVEIYS